MLKSTVSIFVIVLLLFCANPTESQAAPVDLSVWTSSGPVAFSDGGYTATFKENKSYSPVSLKTTLDIPAEAVSFCFDGELFVAADNEDYFDFYLGNTAFPIFIFCKMQNLENKGACYVI